MKKTNKKVALVHNPFQSQSNNFSRENAYSKGISSTKNKYFRLLTTFIPNGHLDTQNP